MNLMTPCANPAGDFIEIARKLGPERCASALAAFYDPDPRGFDGCALARAYGPVGALQHAYRQWAYSQLLELSEYRDDSTQLQAWSTDFLVHTFGLDPSEIMLVIYAFDHPLSDLRTQLHAALFAGAATPLLASV